MQNNFENYNENNECFLSDSLELYNKINNPNAYFQEVKNQSFKARYLNSLIACKQIKNNNNNSFGLNETKNMSLSDSGHGESEIISCNLLTHGDIQECVSQVNADYEQECLGKILN